MATLTRDQLVANLQTILSDGYAAGHDGLVVGRDDDRILIFKPGGPFFAVTVEELNLTPKRAARKPRGTT